MQIAMNGTVNQIGWADQIKAEAKAIAGVKYILGKPVTLNKLLSTLAALSQP